MSKSVIIVGGGIAGLASAIYLARAGHIVTIFEKRRYLGGRAITHLRSGYRFNIGAHALYRAGGAAAVYRELGIPVRGGTPKAKGRALLGNDDFKLPVRFFSLLATSLLPLKAKFEAMRLWWRIRRIDPKPFASISAKQWLKENISDPRLRDVMEALVRLATYCDRLDDLSASVALGQLKLLRRGATYVDEGWQKLVDSLHSAAVAANVNFISASRIVGVEHRDGAVTGIELGGLEMDDHGDTKSLMLPDLAPEGIVGTRLPAQTVLLAIDPVSAAELITDEELARAWSAPPPVVAACLDVALSRLPNPDTTFALGIDQPTYFSVHSLWAQLTPKGGALLHLVKYRKQAVKFIGDELEPERIRRGEESAADERELESLLDRLQPGWREHVVHRRFLPSMNVSNAIVKPGATRPSAVTPIRGLYIAGDWVGDEGWLSDAALTSARAAAKAILASTSA
ncbi:MAG TPA: FAD-dependent oxidoreductase [Thermoanaerobaculia bacterium]|nr:FAD-dependent oxidoreductase [Thermoanaerobaculia bacterium]